jgi:hypothetical protein
MADYNGYTNHATWNVSLWLNGVEADYRHAAEFMRNYRGSTPYRDYIRHAHLDQAMTPDGVAYLDPAVNVAELDEVLREIARTEGEA